MNEKANYGNWVPEKALYMLFGAAVILGALAVIAQAVLGKPVITAVLGVLCIVALIMAVYMLIETISNPQQSWGDSWTQGAINVVSN